MPPIGQLNDLAEQGEKAFDEPVPINWDGTILGRYAVWQLACRQKHETLLCIEYRLDEEEVFRWLLRDMSPREGQNDYRRITFALEMEPLLQEKAKANQRAGGQSKGLPNLAKAQPVHIRVEIAKASGVSTGSVGKVQVLKSNGHPDILDALWAGEISIDGAWKWFNAYSADQQPKLLREFRLKGGIKKEIAKMVRQPEFRRRPPEFDLAGLLAALLELPLAESGEVLVLEVQVPGRAVAVSRELASLLYRQGDLPLS